MSLMQCFSPLATRFGVRPSGTPIPAPPAQLISGGSLSMGSTSTGSAGSEQTFTVEGTSLIGDIVVVGSTNIEVSLSSGSGFASTVSVSPSGGTVTTTTVYARIKSGAAEGSIAENIYSTSAGAAGYAVACTGTVTSGPSFPSSGLVAYWSFDDTLTDTVGSKVLTPSGGNSYVAGKLGTKALQLTATNTADTTDATVLGYFAGACSFQVWFKAATVASERFGFGGDILLDYLAGNFYAQYDYNGSGGEATAAATLTDNTWHHLVVTSDGGANYPKFYLDGSYLVDGTVFTPLAAAASLFGVGAATSASTHAYDALAIWNRQLTAQEVTNLYNSGSGISP